jgi:hypothetical protein
LSPPISKISDRPLQAHLNPTVKSTQFAIDDPPPTPLVESYQSKPLFLQDPIGDQVGHNSSASLYCHLCFSDLLQLHLFSKLTRQHPFNGDRPLSIVFVPKLRNP